METILLNYNNNSSCSTSDQQHTNIGDHGTFTNFPNLVPHSEIFVLIQYLALLWCKLHTFLLEKLKVQDNNSLDNNSARKLPSLTVSLWTKYYIHNL